ncbi:MAG: leucine-rich repeat protein, partial [Treponemataceae bacterium]
MKKIGIITSFILIVFLLVSCADVVSSNLHHVNIDKSISGGQVLLYSTAFKVGDVVEIDIIPNEGFVVEPGSIRYLIDGKPVPIRYNRFPMPSANVVVTVKFVVENNTVLSINKNNVIFQDAIQLSATLENSKSSSYDLVWKSSNPAIASVDQNGMVKSISAGKAVISVSHEKEGVSAACVVEIPASKFLTEGNVITGVVNNTKSLLIPEVVNNVEITEIASEAFKDDTAILEVVIPRTITKIGDGAFENISIRSVNIPVSVEAIGESAFANNSKLSNVVISGE